jgi:hypothetical protein
LQRAKRRRRDRPPFESVMALWSGPFGSSACLEVQEVDAVEDVQRVRLWQPNGEGPVGWAVDSIVGGPFVAQSSAAIAQGGLRVSARVKMTCSRTAMAFNLSSKAPFGTHTEQRPSKAPDCGSRPSAHRRHSIYVGRQQARSLMPYTYRSRLSGVLLLPKKEGTFHTFRRHLW